MARKKNLLCLSLIAVIVNYHFPEISYPIYPVAKSGSEKQFKPIKFIYPSYSTSITASRAKIIYIMSAFKVAKLHIFAY